MSVAAVVLAAGASVRAGSIKALAPIDGETFLSRTIGALRSAGIARVHVVVGEPHAARIIEALPAGVIAVRNESPERGMLSSLQVGLASVRDAERVLVSLVDHPRVRASTIRALLTALEPGALDLGAIVARPRCGGRRGHPYAITGDAIRALREASLDRSARDVLRGLVPALDVEVDDLGVLDDFDRPAAARAWHHRPASQRSSAG